MRVRASRAPASFNDNHHVTSACRLDVDQWLHLLPQKNNQHKFVLRHICSYSPYPCNQVYFYTENILVISVDFFLLLQYTASMLAPYHPPFHYLKTEQNYKHNLAQSKLKSTTPTTPYFLKSQNYLRTKRKQSLLIRPDPSSQIPNAKRVSSARPTTESRERYGDINTPCK